LKNSNGNIIEGGVWSDNKCVNNDPLKVTQSQLAISLKKVEDEIENK